MKNFILAIVAIVVICLAYIVVRGEIAGSHHTPSHISDTRKAQNISNQLEVHNSGVLPKPPLSCYTSASNMSLSSDYSITGMDCKSSNSPNLGVVLYCNGTLLQHATNVTLNCQIPSSQPNSNGVACSGTTNAASSPVNLALNFSCYANSSLAGNSVYTCSGELANYNTRGINLPLSVNCGP